MKHSILSIAALSLATVATPQTCLADSELPDALHLYSTLEYNAALPILLPLAQHENAVAQEILGFMFLQGEGVSRDEARALDWFTLAAKAGRPDSQVKLGEMYLKGEGTQIDEEAALFWLRRAADQGKMEAFETLAQYYWNQCVYPADAVAALQVSLEAAKRGSAKAMYAIGLHYAAGLHIARDDIEALMWLDLASNLAIDIVRDEVLRAKSAVAENLMPGQVQIALSRSRDWWRTHFGE